MKKLNKKGMFFTLMSMLLIGLITLALTTPPKNVTGLERLGPTTTKIHVLNDLTQSINTIFIESAVTTATYNELKYIADNGITTNFFTDFETALEEPTGANSRSIKYWFNQLKQKVEQTYHATIELENFNVISVQQQPDEPYKVTVAFRIQYTINKDDPILSWNVTDPSSLWDASAGAEIIKVDIIGIPDPDNPGEQIIPDTEGGPYITNTAGKSFLNKLGSLGTYVATTRLCPSITSPECP